MWKNRLNGWRFYAAVAAAGVLAFVVTVLTGVFLLAPEMPSFEEVRAARRLSDSVLLDRNGAVLHELRTDPGGRRLEWVSLGEISPALLRAVVAAEDGRFYGHAGVDVRALASSLLRPGSTLRGASTISMQLASRIDPSSTPAAGRRTAGEKIRQIAAAIALERRWSKDEILEAYLNLITFRGELQGIAAASRGLFDKEPSGLNETESLLLAALVPSARTSPEAAARRAARIAARMNPPRDPREVSSLALETLNRPYRIRPRADLAPHAARLLLTRPGERVRCTIDGDLQLLAAEVLNRNLSRLRDRNVRDGAVLVADNATGDVLAYVGNPGAASSAPHVDGVRALRQAGSTLKPFLYGMALENRVLTAASLLDDSPLQIPVRGGLYVPENYNRSYLGPVSLRTALSSSLNIPAVRTLMLVTPGALVEKLRAMGFEGLDRDGDHYGYSLALGSADVSLFELVNAYRTLANGGLRGRLRLAAGADAGTTEPVMDPRAAFLVSSILSDREARSATFGLENPLATRFWTAVKTGTSKDMRDNWCVGYSERYTVGVWVGNFNGEPMWDVSGVSGAAPVWLDLMNALHARHSSRPPRAVAGIRAAAIAFAGSVEPPRTEWFIEGTEPGDAVARRKSHEPPRILYPRPSTVITIDPDIPADLQRVAFQGRLPDGAGEWRLDGHPLGSEPSVLWKPERGKHVLQWMDEKGETVDSVSFTVR